MRPTRPPARQPPAPPASRLLAPTAARASPPRQRHGPTAVLTGFDTLARDGYRMVAGQRVGLISNPTGVVTDLRHEVDVMAADDRVDLVAAFGPEHGFRGSAAGRWVGGRPTSTRAPASRSTTPTRKTPTQIAEFFARRPASTP